MDPQSDRLRAIIATQTEIAACDLDLLATMNLIAERSQELTCASAAVIEIVEGEEMVYEVTTGDATPYLGMRLDLAGSLSGLCVTEGRLLRSDDTSEDPRVDGEACRRVGAASMICVPLVHRRETVGVLKVYSGLANGFSDDDVETLELLTDLIAAHIAARHPLRGRGAREPPRRAHRPLQPPRLRGAAGGRDLARDPLRAAALDLPARPRRLQGRSTTASATRPATTCCARSPG